MFLSSKLGLVSILVGYMIVQKDVSMASFFKALIERSTYCDCISAFLSHRIYIYIENQELLFDHAKKLCGMKN